MNESIHRQIKEELVRFPYMSDENRTDENIEALIERLFNSQNSLALEYDGGYIIFREIGLANGKKTADVFWIHFKGRDFTHTQVRAAKKIFDAAKKTLELDRLTMKSPSFGVCMLAESCGFKFDNKDNDEIFSWHGATMPVFHMVREG
jgi:hypothetical protein